jgi:hypothetical protein
MISTTSSAIASRTVAPVRAAEVRSASCARREPGLQRVVAADALQVLGHEEGLAHERAGEQEARRVRADALAAGEQAQRHDRLRGARLAGDEQREQSAARDQRRERPGITPAGAGGAHDAAHEQARPERRDGAGDDVEAPGPALGLGNAARREHHRRDPDRDVDQEPDAPAQHVREEAAEDEPRGG